MPTAIKIIDEISQMIDVSLTDLQNDQALIYNSSAQKWENKRISAAIGDEGLIQFSDGLGAFSSSVNLSYVTDESVLKVGGHLFVGNMTDSPQGIIHVSSSNESVPPFVLTEYSSLLNTPVEGSFEFSNNKLYFTPSSSREQIAFVNDITASNFSGTLPIAKGGTGQVTANNAFNALAPSQTGNNGKVLQTDGSNTSWVSIGGVGTVTSVSVTTANGFAGSVATSTTTPAITISTTITGILSGNGTAISAASTTGSGAVVLASSATVSNLTIENDFTISSATNVNINSNIEMNSNSISGVDTLNSSSVNSTNINASFISGSSGSFHYLALNNPAGGSGAHSSNLLDISNNNSGWTGSYFLYIYDDVNDVEVFKVAENRVVTFPASSGAPFVVASSTVVTDLNADLLDGYEASYFQNQIDAKLSTSLTSANIYVGNGSNIATPVSVSGDIGIDNAGVTAIGSNKVTLGMLATVATETFLGRTTAGTGNVEALTVAQATALLDVFTSTLKGLAPASGGGTSKFLRADGSWAAPLSTPTTPGGSNTHVQFNNSSSFGGSANFTWTNSTGALTVTGVNTSADMFTVTGPSSHSGKLQVWKTNSSSVLQVLSSGVLESLISTGTAPFVVASTTKVTNLNADLLDGSDSTAFSPVAGSSSIVTVGTITSGTWNGSTVGILYGGTGQTSASSAFNALSPMTTLGDIIYGASSGVGTRLAGNTTTTRNFLRQTGDGVNSDAPAWDTVTKADVGLGSVENTALSTWAGSTNITTLGTIATGTWNATIIGPTKGGTGVANNVASTLTISGNFATTLTISGITSVTLPTSGTLATLAGSESLTNKKLGSLTSNGFVKTSSGDGTLSVDTSTYLTGNQTITLSGDVSGSGATSITTTIGANVVTFAKFQQISTASILGRNTGGTGDVEELSASTTKTLLSLNNVENTALSTWTGSTNITTLGTIATGTWNGSVIGLSYGGTNSNLSATGGTGQFLKQLSSGASVTVATISASELPNHASRHQNGGADEIAVAAAAANAIPKAGSNNRIASGWGFPYILEARSYTGTTFTGAGALTVYSITVPANTLGTNKLIRFLIQYRRTTGSGNFTPHINYGGTNLDSLAAVAGPNYSFEAWIGADGSTSAQRAYVRNNSGTNTQTGVGTAAIDSTVNQTLAFTITMATTTDVVTVDRVIVEVLE